MEANLKPWKKEEPNGTARKTSAPGDSKHVREDGGDKIALIPSPNMLTILEKSMLKPTINNLGVAGKWKVGGNKRDIQVEADGLLQLRFPLRYDIFPVNGARKMIERHVVKKHMIGKPRTTITLVCSARDVRFEAGHGKGIKRGPSKPRSINQFLKRRTGEGARGAGANPLRNSSAPIDGSETKSTALNKENKWKPDTRLEGGQGDAGAVGNK